MMRNAGEVLSAVRLPLCAPDSSVEELYASMAAIRAFEQSLLEMFGRGVLAGTTHTCIGQEATSVGVLSAIDRERDVVVSNHRGHGHFLAYCGEVERLYLELMGKPGGVCGGRGGSQHLYWRNFYSNGILGSTVPVATGMAMAEKRKRSGATVVVFMGEGALGEGVVYEAMNMASLWRLPVLFVVENNGYAQSTPWRLQVAGSLRARPEAFGIPVVEQATTDVREIRTLATDLMREARRDRQPHCLLLTSYRLGPHSKGDDTRDPAEIEAAWTREPLRLLEQALGSPRTERLRGEAAALVEQANARALAAPSHDA